MLHQNYTDFKKKQKLGLKMNANVFPKKVLLKNKKNELTFHR